MNLAVTAKLSHGQSQEGNHDRAIVRISRDHTFSLRCWVYSAAFLRGDNMTKGNKALITLKLTKAEVKFLEGYLDCATPWDQSDDDHDLLLSCAEKARATLARIEAALRDDKHDR